MDCQEQECEWEVGYQKGVPPECREDQGPSDTTNALHALRPTRTHPLRQLCTPLCQHTPNQEHYLDIVFVLGEGTLTSSMFELIDKIMQQPLTSTCDCWVGLGVTLHVHIFQMHVFHSSVTHIRIMLSLASGVHGHTLYMNVFHSSCTHIPNVLALDWGSGVHGHTLYMNVFHASLTPIPNVLALDWGVFIYEHFK